MPNRDTHYDLTAAVLKLWGHSQQVIDLTSWASQMTDECTSANMEKWNVSHLGLFPTQCYDYDWWKDGVDPRIIIWVTYHFPYGADRVASEYLIRKDIEMLHELLQRAEDCLAVGNMTAFREYAITAGIYMHLLFDGLTGHSFFWGWRDGRNHKKNGDIVSVIVPAIGHAEYQSIPDTIDAKPWTAPSGVRVRNQDLWMEAGHQLWPKDVGGFEEYARLIAIGSKAKRIKAAGEISGVPKFKVGKQADICLFLHTARKGVLGK